MAETVLVTGASRGIGRVVALYLMEKGYHVVAVARTEPELQALVSGREERARYIVCDLADPANVKSIFERLSEWQVVLSGAVYCAGVCTPQPIKIADAEVMKRDMNINALSFVEMGKYFSRKKYMGEGAGIVAVSSMSAWDKTKGMCVYSMSKAALNTAVETMAKEFVKRKIRVNAILPAYVNTSMTIHPESKDAQLAQLQEKQPLGIIEPEYIAYMVEFLLSEKAKVYDGIPDSVDSRKNRKIVPEFNDNILNLL